MSYDTLFHSPLHSDPSHSLDPLDLRDVNADMDLIGGKDPKLYVPQPKIYRRPPYTVEAPGYTKVDGETIPRRNTLCKDALLTVPEEGVDTIYALVRRSCSRFGNARAMGKRRLIKTHEETRKVKKVVDGKEQDVDRKWTYFELGPYEFMTFTEYEQLVLKIGSGFRKLGMVAEDRVHLFAATHPYWLATAHGASSQSMPIVTAYDTLGEEGLKHSLQQTKAKAIFLDPQLLTKLIKPLNEAKAIQHVIYNDDEAPTCKPDPAKLPGDIKALKEAHPHLNILAFSEFVKMGAANMVDPVPPKPEDLCCIMYTSGSTGTPKGVVLTHANVMASMAGINQVYGDYIGPHDDLLAYLPLAHILELIFESACIFWGGCMGYGHPRTLNDSNLRNSKGDILEFKPTVIVGVPAVWESVKKGIMTKVNKSNAIVRNMFWGALSAKSFMMDNSGYLPLAGLGTSIVDQVVFKKISEATGGRMRLCLSGGGPVAKETQRFISMCIAPMVSGYGATETAAMGALQDPLAWTDSALGGLPGSVEVKLVDFPEAGYYSTNKPQQGEIWIRGGSITKGYLDLEEETKEAFTDDGWFKTGDIGQWDSYGQLKIIDRKKNLVKTLAGEYIALEKLESVYRSCPVVGNLCVYAAADRQKPIAIVFPVEHTLKSLASENGVKGDDFEQLCQNSKVRSAALEQMQTTGKRGGLTGIEIIDGIVLTDEEWTPQNGLLTSAQKLNRKGLFKKYEKDIDHAYGKN